MSLEDTYRAVREEVSLEGQLGLPLPLLWQRLQVSFPLLFLCSFLFIFLFSFKKGKEFQH